MNRCMGMLLLRWWRFEFGWPRTYRAIVAALQIAFVAGFLAFFAWLVSR